MIGIVTKLAKDVNILKFEKGVPVVATPPHVARVPVDATPPIGATPSSTNTPNMPTNDGYWYNSNEGGGMPNDGSDGHTH